MESHLAKDRALVSVAIEDMQKKLDNHVAAEQPRGCLPGA